MRHAATTHHRTVLLLCLLLASGFAAARDIYRWVDAQGRTHFDDRHAHRSASQVQLHSLPTPEGPGVEADRTGKTQRLLDQFAAERARRESDRQQAAQAVTAKAAACREARGRAIEAEEAGYLYDRDERGRKRILGDAETRAAREHVRSEATRLCD